MAEHGWGAMSAAEENDPLFESAAGSGPVHVGAAEVRASGGGGTLQTTALIVNDKLTLSG